MFGSGVRNERGERGGFLKESVILCPANRKPGGIHEWRIRRARANVVLLEMRQALSRPIWRDQGVSRGNLSALQGGEQGRCIRLPSADEADAAVDMRRQEGHLGGLLLGGRQSENIGTQQFQELASRYRNSGLSPFADGRRFDFAQPRNLGSAAESIDDQGIDMSVFHALIVGIPTDEVNRHSYQPYS